MLFNGAQQRLPLQGPRGFFLDEGLNPNFKVGRVLDELHDASLGQALDQDLDPVVGKFQHARHHPHRTDGMDVRVRRIVHFQRALSGEHDNTISCHGCLDGLDRHVPTHKQWQNHIGKHHYVPDRQQRKSVGNRNL